LAETLKIGKHIFQKNLKKYLLLMLYMTFVLLVVFSHVAGKINFKSLEAITCVALLNAKALFTRDIFAHNIAIKRYCDKKIFLSH